MTHPANVMAVNDELLAFINEGLRRGLPRPELREVLLRAGWEDAQVTRALASFAEVEFVIPVPRP